MTPIRVAVLSPFIDKRHGTERRIAEWVSRLPQDYDIHIYSQRVEDLDLTRMTWHRIPAIPGPHIINFLWWFVANHFYRWWDGQMHGLRYDLVYTAGTNCIDADLISVHIVFSEFVSWVAPELKFSANPVKFWPTLIHRKLYYKLIIFLERHLYTNPKTDIILIAKKTAVDLKHHYGIDGDLPVVYIGLDQQVFNVESRVQNRAAMRQQLGLRDDQFALVMVGNDWKKKGIAAMLDALAMLKDLPVMLVVAGKDDATPYHARIKELGLEDRVTFQPSRADVQSYYAAADVYLGPSLEDTFAQPPAEAMACGLPVITTVTNGTAEIMTDGVDGLIMQDPNDAADLAAKIRQLYVDPDLRERMGEAAHRTARNYTWDRNGEQMRAIFAERLNRKGHGGVSAPAKSML